MAGFGVQEGIGLAGAVGNFLTGRSQAKASKEMLRRQSQLANMQNQTYRAAQPIYQQALQQYAQQAGVGPNGSGNLGTGHMGSNWGTQADQLRFAAAEEQNRHIAQQRQNALMHTLAGRGVASSSVGAALAHNQQAALQDLAGFHRNLAIDAAHEQQQRMGQLMGALGPAFGQGAQAQNVYGQQGAMFGQQAQNSFNGIGGIVQNWQQQQALQDYMRRYGVHPGGTTDSYGTLSDGWQGWGNGQGSGGLGGLR